MHWPPRGIAVIMPRIRIPEEHWGPVWHALVASGPISRFTQELIYVVSDKQVRMLRRKKLPFELLASANGIFANMAALDSLPN
jgi:hypothetical protein